MLCPTGLTLSEELKAAGLEVSIAEAERDDVGVIAARGRKRDAQRALNEHRVDCDICANP
jgi:NADPH-dependent glutamate synthase beta subunit-like oxidoreductase